MSTSGREWRTGSPEATEAVAERLAAELRPGDLLLLEGDLGAGKTTFVRGLARGLGADPARVQSPTFTLVRLYRGATPLAHLDLYRLETSAELADLGLDELLDDHVVAVEWGDRLRIDHPRTARVHFEDEGPGRRRIVVTQWFS